MKKILILALFAVAALPLMAGCDLVPCTPHAAYYQPAWTDPGHYDSTPVYAGQRTHYSCTYTYSSYSGRSYRRCTPYSVAVYRSAWYWVSPVYHPRQYVPAVHCAKKTS